MPICLYSRFETPGLASQIPQSNFREFAPLSSFTLKFSGCGLSARHHSKISWRLLSSQNRTQPNCSLYALFSI
uniref:Uncharacterized protein n=1 Tax=uncultured gamma proteobacterium HF0010_16J05 TaxID=710981 RepID=E0XR49_9GAMM|nr:hypothetical protein [uncultured gamma proteobacterium HF0010_16J05]